MEKTGIDPSTAGVLHSAIHDLKGPAGRLRLLSQLLGAAIPTADSDTRTILKHIDDSAAAVGKTAEALKSYVEVCGRPLEREQVGLNLLLQAGLASLRSRIAPAGVQVECSELPTAAVDRFLLTWLFEELIWNAIRFNASPVPGIRVHSGSGGPGGWFVAVADDGPGIEAAMAERVFRPFTRVGPAGGAGMGLTICREIVERHGGRIWVEPVAGGAELRFFVGGASHLE
jgi:signal transduction histidine kinase